jgi:tyrosyl-tRNA synthetase
VEEKKKQRKDKGSRYPGGAAAKNVETQPDGSVEGKDKKKLVYVRMMEQPSWRN